MQQRLSSSWTLGVWELESAGRWNKLLYNLAQSCSSHTWFVPINHSITASWNSLSVYGAGLSSGHATLKWSSTADCWRVCSARDFWHSCALFGNLKSRLLCFAHFRYTPCQTSVEYMCINVKHMMGLHVSMKGWNLIHKTSSLCWAPTGAISN